MFPKISGTFFRNMIIYIYILYRVPYIYAFMNIHMQYMLMYVYLHPYHIETNTNIPPAPVEQGEKKKRRLGAGRSPYAFLVWCPTLHPWQKHLDVFFRLNQWFKGIKVSCVRNLQKCKWTKSKTLVAKAPMNNEVNGENQKCSIIYTVYINMYIDINVKCINTPKRPIYSVLTCIYPLNYRTYSCNQK